VGQLPKLLGETTNFSGQGFIRSIVAVVAAVPHANPATIALSVVSILVLLGLSRFVPRLPGSLVVVVGGILLVAFTNASDHGIRLIATVPGGLPGLTVPTFRDLGSLIPGAMAIAIMAFLESAAVARGIRKPGTAQIDSNRELLAAGGASLIGAFFHSMPAAGGFSQSAVNLKAGARSQLATLVTVALAVLVALFLGPILSLLPEATLASMVFVAVVGLIDVPEMIRLARLSPPEFWISVLTAAVGLSAGLLSAVAVGVALTLVLVLRELNRPRVEIASRSPEVLVLRLGSALYTANVLGTIRVIEQDIDDAGRPRTVILDVAALRTVSVMVLDSIADLDRELAGTSVELHIAALPAAALELARKTRWWHTIESEHRSHASVDEALAAVARAAG
jgi:MFS superfamily sulfate permease-like transporter